MYQLLKKSLSQSFSYPEFRSLMETWEKEEKTSGTEQTEERIHYTKLNSSRMRRLDKTLKLTPEQQAAFNRIKSPQIWLVLVESWCGDGAQTLPVLNLIADSPAIDLRILLRDDNPELIDAFLTNGTRSIPKLLILNSQF